VTDRQTGGQTQGHGIYRASTSSHDKKLIKNKRKQLYTQQSNKRDQIKLQIWSCRQGHLSVSVIELSNEEGESVCFRMGPRQQTGCPTLASCWFFPSLFAYFPYFFSAFFVFFLFLSAFPFTFLGCSVSNVACCSPCIAATGRCLDVVVTYFFQSLFQI